MESTMLDLAALAVATQHNPFLGHFADYQTRFMEREEINNWTVVVEYTTMRSRSKFTRNGCAALCRTI